MPKHSTRVAVYFGVKLRRIVLLIIIIPVIFKIVLSIYNIVLTTMMLMIDEHVKTL